MAHDEHEGFGLLHDGWLMLCASMKMAHDEGCSHTYEDGPHEAHDGWAWDGMGKYR